MESKTFTGKDQYDVDRQIWDWRQANPTIKVVKTHSAEEIPLRMRASSPNHGPIPPAQDRVSVKVDFASSKIGRC
jgi:hypothetical protein